jgi:nucleotide-binding universal stress UspA family protein
MIKTILVPVAGVAEDKPRLLAALAVARRFDAHLDVLHVRPDPAQLVASAASAAYGVTELVAALIDQFEKDAQARLEAAQESFAAFVKGESLALRDRRAAGASGASGASAAWLKQIGNAGDHVARLARSHDLVVAGRSSDSQGPTSGTLELALMEGGRPVLVIPQGTTQVPGRTVVIGWKDSAESARAVMAAGPFLALADRIEVVAVSENETGEGQQDRESAERLVESLAWHDVKANARVVPARGASGPEALLAAVKDLDGDLVVMGAYGHSRLREMIFGGFTRHVLRGADVPVLMFH